MCALLSQSWLASRYQCNQSLSLNADVRGIDIYNNKINPIQPNNLRSSLR